MRDVVLAIDEGTTGVTVQAIDRSGAVRARRYSELPQHFPQPGWVEHDPFEIRDVTIRLVREAAGEAGRDRIAAVGITNQRETTILWERATGRPIHRAIVWQDRRTTDLCGRLKRRGLERDVRRRTGLVLDPYFSGTKVRWLLDHVEGARAAARAGRLAFGTIDTWLIHVLTGGRVHATDPTNASRTMFLNLATRAWDPEMLRMLGVPAAMLPEVRPSAGDFGRTDAAVVGFDAPIAGVAGDQQAALFGQACVSPGSLKNTYGTGSFLVMNTGGKLVRSRHGLLTTLACGPKGEPAYALEGSIFITGAAVQWLRDGLKIVEKAAETEPLARSVASAGGVHVVPAFVGLGAPHWRADVRGAILGLTRGTGRAEIARATLESIAFQTRDVMEALRQDSGLRAKELRVDGGAVANDWLMQFQADVLGVPVVRPANIATTSLGAAFLAGLATGVWGSVGEAAKALGEPTEFRPSMARAERERLYTGWKRAIQQLLD